MKLIRTSIYYILLLCLVAAYPIPGLAQNKADDFTDLQASDYPPTGDMLPLYSRQFDITGWKGAVEPRLEYPVYEELTRAEVEAIKAKGISVADSIVPFLSVSQARLRRLADVSFSPFVKRDGKYMRLVSFKLSLDKKAGVPRLSASTRTTTDSKADRWKSHSVLASGKWVKIRVKDEGVYQINASDLSGMGFTDLSRLKLYGYGGRVQSLDWKFDGTEGSVPDDLNEVPLYRRDGSVIFWADGTVAWTWNERTAKWTHENQPYSDYSYYFLTEGDSPAAFETEPSATGGSTSAYEVSTVKGHAVIDNDANYFYAGGRELYDPIDLSSGRTNTYRIATPGVVAGSKATVDIGFATFRSNSGSEAVFTLNDEEIGSLRFSASSETTLGTEKRTYFTADSLTSDNVFGITATAGITSRLNYVRVNYDRTLSAADAPWPFVTGKEGLLDIVVHNASATTMLWRLGTSADNPTCALTSSLSGTTLTATTQSDDASSRYVIVDGQGQYPSVEVVGSVDNQDLHATTAQDMVIIVPQSGKLEAEANRLAEAHRANGGLRVVVVNAAQLYNEFSSGTPDISAYRRFMKMLYDRADSEADLPSSLLLFGDCAWDNRMITDKWKGYDKADFLLCYERNHTNTYSPGNYPLEELYCYVTDDVFSWLDDSEGSNFPSNKADIAIGRFPCLDAETAKVLVDKSIAYMENKEVGSWKNQIYILGDDKDNNLHMRSADYISNNIVASTGGKFQIRKVYWDAYKRTYTTTQGTYPEVTALLREFMAKGALMFNYSGHGNPSQISYYQVLTQPDFNISSNGRLPLWIMASCEICPFDMQENDIGRTALYNPTGGAIAMMCASRSVYANDNERLNNLFCQYVLSVGPDGKPYTMGEALRQTKAGLSNNQTDLSVNTQKYVLLGDPALPLAFPCSSVVIDSINGQPLTESSFVQLKSGSQARFSGYVATDDGSVDTSFSGFATGTVMDKEETITCKKNESATSTAYVYKDRTKTVFEGSDSVRQGRFSISMYVPRDISYSNSAALLSVYAANNAHTIEAHGKTEQFFMNGTDTSAAPDTLSPQAYLYLDTPDFVSGGIVSDAPVFIAEVKDDYGLSASGISVGHDMELTLDGDATSAVNLNSYFSYDFGSYSSGLVTYPMSGLSKGNHSLSFTVWDVNGNSTVKNLDFCVGEKSETSLDINATTSPATTTTNFVVTIPNASELQDAWATIRVYSVSGQEVWNSGRILTSGGYLVYPWNLSTSAGAPLPSGIYVYLVELDSSLGEQKTDAKKMVVLKQ